MGSALAGLQFISETGPDDVGVGPIAWEYDTRNFAFGSTRQVITVLNTSQNLGYAGGVNACIAAVSKLPWDAIWVLNPDTFPDPEALMALVRHQKAGGYGIVGSRLIFNSTGRIQTWGGMKWRSWLGRGQSLGLNMPSDMAPDLTEVERALGFISGASMYVSRDYIDSIGVMDEDFFVYNEDVDWCLRHGAFRLGYAHGSIVRHINGGTSGAFSSSGSRFTVYLGSRNCILLAKKRHRFLWPILAATALIHMVAHLLRTRSLRRFSFALDGWWAGVRGERGAPNFIRKGPDRSAEGIQA